MAFKEKDIPAGAVNVREYRDNSTTDPNPMWLYDTFTGCCVSEREMNGYNDSDFYMTVWDETEQKFKSIMFATTRGWTYPCLASRVDATEEVMARYQAKLQAEREQAQAERDARIKRTPAKGKTLKVVKGRKVKIGTVGLCIWAGSSNYGDRVGIKTDDGQVHWTAASNVEVVL